MNKLIARIMYYTRFLRSSLPFYGIRVPFDGFHLGRTTWTTFKFVYRGDYEGPEVNALLGLVRKGDRLLELGGGLGIISGVAANAADNAHLLIFEANPALIPHIKTLHKLNGLTNTEIRNQLVFPKADAQGRSFFVHNSFGASSVVEHKKVAGTVEVPVVAFPDVVAEFRPDILICDIEGAEAELFDGIDLSGFRAAVIEVHPSLVSPEKIKRLFETCLSAGLSPRVDLFGGTVVAFERQE